jgi:prevent-host-death family protein
VNITTIYVDDMEEPISAAEANRHFSKLLRGVRQGLSYVVTVHGNAIAKIIPVNKSAQSDAGKRLLLSRLRAQPAVTIGGWRREDLYERTP